MLAVRLADGARSYFLAFYLAGSNAFVSFSEIAVKATESEEMLALLPHQAGLKQQLPSICPSSLD